MKPEYLNRADGTEFKAHGGELLYKGEGGWSMYAWDDESILPGNASFLVHACTLSDIMGRIREVYIFPDTHKACWRCQAALPEGMKALWIMHNERI